tara:strand:- start:11120 stop:11299 length:180 start_codon:yes stop_codon:yes gene_type:complete
MTLDDLHQKLSVLACSGMEDNHYTANTSGKNRTVSMGHLEKIQRRRPKKELSVQLSLFD